MRGRHGRRLLRRFLSLLGDPWGRCVVVLGLLYAWVAVASCVLRLSSPWWVAACLAASGLITVAGWASARRELDRARAELGRMKDER